ncbi:MAG: tetratricopeptide repeat protein [Cyanobacteria bacterium P01_H01_bin.15]
MTPSPWEQGFAAAIAKPAADINLLEAALWIAKSEYPNLEPQAYFDVVDRMALEAQSYLPEAAYPLKIIQGLNRFFFKGLDFTGNQENYYDPRNSYLNEVIERRTGIPISLAILYREVSNRLDFPMIGVGMPGHFLLKPNFPEAGIYVDVFHEGAVLFPEDCAQLINGIYGESVDFDPDWLAPISAPDILLRMLNNLRAIFLQQGKWQKMKQNLEFCLLLVPDNPQFRRDRGLICYQLEQTRQAIPDLEFYVQNCPQNADVAMIHQLLDKIR